MSNRARVSSFISNLTKRSDSPNSPLDRAPPPLQTKQHEPFPNYESRQDILQTPVTSSPLAYNGNGNESPQPQVQRERASSRPMSMVQTFQPPLMDVTQDTLPELQPIFTFLNSHGNKLYQEGYFLKLDDQDTYGRPNADRTWTECFAQLVGTVLSLWDAAELDTAGEDGEVLPKFINLTDASIKMIESLPTRSDSEPPLQNVLSISTAGKNRYLLHFNSHHSLIQWTAGIRLSMFEHATLQEAYTGALIAGKGKALNNINLIMERTKIKTEDWARVRFGAGTPWRRCWCVITPPDEKEVMKLQKQASKKKSAYDRSKLPTLKGDIRFYDSKKTKKVMPIATITDAYTAFAIYPQAKPLIDASTLVKVEGSITIHSNPPSTTEGFVFVMPEVHPAVTGFEMMLRWLFPVFDTFALYGRPGRLVADTTNPDSLMFAMPKHRRYGYLEILDVSGLILEQGSSEWRESEWRRRMKDLTQKRMTAIENGSRPSNRFSSTPSRRSTRNSFGPSRSRIHFDDAASTRSSPSIGWQAVPSAESHFVNGFPRTDSAPPTSGTFTKAPGVYHNRSVSETHGMDRYGSMSSNYDGIYEPGPTPPLHAAAVMPDTPPSNLKYMEAMGTPDRVSSESEGRTQPVRELQDLRETRTPEPVAAPPAFSHNPGTLPVTKPYHSNELRRANSRMSTATLSQITGISGVAAAGGATDRHVDENHTAASEEQGQKGPHSEGNGHIGVLSDANNYGYPANHDGLNEGFVDTTNNRFSFDGPSPPRHANNTHTNYIQSPPSLSYATSNAASSTQAYDSSQVFSSVQTSSNRQSHQPHNSADLNNTHPSINRKPVPVPVHDSSIRTPTSANTMSSTGTLKEHVFDDAAFDMIQPTSGLPTTTTTAQRPLRERAETDTSVYEDSNYDDDEPDYASTISSTKRPSFDMKKYRQDKPRAGVLKTVGVSDGTGEPRGLTGPPVPIPNVNFGPTMNLAPRRASPGPSQMYSTSSGNGNSRGPSPALDMPPPIRPQSTGQTRSPTRGVPALGNVHHRNDSNESRTLAWQPAMSNMSLNHGPKSPGITPEQFVQQRAAAVTPQYAHQRNSSSQGTLSTSSPTLVKNLSSDRLAQLGHSRNSSTDLLQRPSSRGPLASYGGPAGNGDMPAKLSAREQEHVARVTGQPLVNMAGNKKHVAGGGLVGAIETREKERQQMKQGINSQAVQQAISKRQQQAVQPQYSEQGHYGQPRSPHGNMAQYPQQYAGQAQSHQQWAPPVANVWAQNGGYAAPSPTSNYGYMPEHTPSPSMHGMANSPSQQFFPPQQRPQPGHGQGRGNYETRPY